MEKAGIPFSLRPKSTKKVANGKKSQKCKKSCQTALFSSKALLRASILILFFVLIFTQGGVID